VAPGCPVAAGLSGKEKTFCRGGGGGGAGRGLDDPDVISFLTVYGAFLGNVF
jgi:hypothetical protein